MSFFWCFFRLLHPFRLLRFGVEKEKIFAPLNGGEAGAPCRPVSTALHSNILPLKLIMKHIKTSAKMLIVERIMCIFQ